MTSQRAIRYMWLAETDLVEAAVPAARAHDPAEDQAGLSMPVLDVVDTVRDDSVDRRRLPEALARLAAGDASVLTVPELRAAAGSLRDLVDLLDWLDAAGCTLLADDLGLDTGSSAGRRTAAVLRDVAEWEMRPSPGGPRRGRPGLEQLAPDLAARIANLRRQGLSLQRIADALNADGIPTPRGGSEWRPSSVQAALGYRRPRHGGPRLPERPGLPGEPEPLGGPAPRRPRPQRPHDGPEASRPDPDPRHGPSAPAARPARPRKPGTGRP
jgi:DNA invertase Pin-like site-specific DNA recombinase